MKPFRGASSSTAGLISIASIYVALIAVILVFARQIISDASLDTPLTNVIVIPLAVLLPLFMFIAIGIYLFRLLRDRRQGKAGAKLKTRLMVVFTVVALISSVPQGILSVSFIEIAMNRWFSSPASEGLTAGVDLVLQYNLDQVENLTVFGASLLLTETLRDLERTPRLVWQRIRSTVKFVHGMQAFTESGREVVFFGDTRALTSGTSVVDRSEGLLPKEIYPEYSVLRYLRRTRIGATDYVVVLSSIIPKDFDRKAELLSAASDTFNQIDLFQPMFRLVVIVFYTLFALPLVLLSILISFLLSEELIRPIASLENATRRVAEGDFSFRILGRGNHELATLARSFNAMVTELERSRNKLMQTEKVAAWQEIAQRMAHEIKNPLTPIKLSAQRILHRYRQDPGSIDRVLEPAIESIVGEVDNLNELLREFRDFARLPEPKLAPVALGDLVDEVLAVYAGAHPEVEVRLDDLDRDLFVPVDRDQMKRVFSNLLKNAFEAIRGRGTVSVTTDLVRKGDSSYCRIQITDTGTGIDTDYHGRVFNPYFTTKQAGTGLGLSIVERIVFDHRGQIWFETESGVGTTFFVDLPMEAE